MWCYCSCCKGFLCIQKVQLVLVRFDNTLLKKMSELGFCQCEQALFVDKVLEAVTAQKREKLIENKKVLLHSHDAVELLETLLCSFAFSLLHKDCIDF